MCAAFSDNKRKFQPSQAHKRCAHILNMRMSPVRHNHKWIQITVLNWVVHCFAIRNFLGTQRQTSSFAFLVVCATIMRGNERMNDRTTEKIHEEKKKRNHMCALQTVLFLFYSYFRWNKINAEWQWENKEIQLRNFTNDSMDCNARKLNAVIVCAQFIPIALTKIKTQIECNHQSLSVSMTKTNWDISSDHQIKGGKDSFDGLENYYY